MKANRPKPSRRTIKSRHALAALAALAELSAHAAGIHVKDHGALPDDGKDDTVAVNAAIAAAQPGDTIRFDAGTYGFDGEGIQRFDPDKYNPLPGHPDKLPDGLKAGIDITRREGLTLRGALNRDEEPATVLMRKNPLQQNKQPPQQILVLHSKDITVENFKITMDQRFTMIWEIVEVTPDRLIARVPEGYPVSEDMISSYRSIICPEISPAVGYHGAGFKGPKLNGTWKTIDASKRLQAAEAEPGDIKPGHILTAPFAIGDGQSNLAVAFSDDVIVRNIWVDSGSFRGTHYFATRNLNIDGLCISPEGDFQISTARGGTTIVNALGTLRVNQYNVYTCGDDALPSWASGPLVRKILDKRTVLYSKAWHSPVRVGSLPAPMEWLNPETGQREFVGNCIAITPMTEPPPKGEKPWKGGNTHSTSKVGRITLDRDLPAGLREFAVGERDFQSYLWFADNVTDRVEYTNSSFNYPLGSIRFPYKKGSLIRNNVFQHTGLGLKSQNEWVGEDVPGVGNIEIEDNLFVEAGAGITAGSRGNEPESIRLPNINFRRNVLFDSEISAHRPNIQPGWVDSVVENNLVDDPARLFGRYGPPPENNITVTGTRKATLLLYDHFIRNFITTKFSPEWEAVSGTWEFDPDVHKYYKQTDTGTEPKLSVVGDATWDNGFVKVQSRRVADTGTLGIVARYRDPANCVVFEQDDKAVRIVRVAGGKRNVLAESAFAPKPGQWVALRLDTAGGKLTGQVDGKTLVEATDPNPGPGRAGLFSQGGRAKFDDFIAVQPQ